MTRYPTLEGIEDRAADTAAVAVRYWTASKRDNRDPATRDAVLAELDRCWCGDPSGHGWPGKADGAPHPRVLPEGLRREPDPQVEYAAAEVL